MCQDREATTTTKKQITLNPITVADLSLSQNSDEKEEISKIKKRRN